MKKILFTAALTVLSCGIMAEEAAQPAGGKFTEYKFRLCLLVKGRMIKKIPPPEYGHMKISAFPVRAREFTFPAKYMDYKSDKTIGAKSAELLLNLKENRRQNALYVTQEIEKYVKEGIADDPEPAGPSGDAHSMLRNAGTVIKDGRGRNVEKCRLAVAMLRSVSIPANTVFYRSRYAVEYFMKPLKGDSGWYLMDFKAEAVSPAAAETETLAYPVTWYPLDSKELLNEEWENSELSLRVVSEKNTYYPDDYEKAKADFDALTITGKSPENGSAAPEKKFYVIRETEYAISLPEPVSAPARAVVKFTLPFNERDTFKLGSDRGSYKTVKYFLESTDERLKASYTRAHVITKPPQAGIVFYLPVKFTAEMK